jgi:transposase-like protein
MFFCPVCKSQEIFPVAGGFVGGIYLCKNCGYRGAFILEIEGAAPPREMEKEPADRK